MMLTDLGIHADDGRIYRSILTKPAAVPEIARTLDIGEAVVESAVRRMADLELVSVTEAGLITATEPRPALERLAHRRVGEHLKSLEQLTEGMSALPGVLAEMGVRADGAVIEEIRSGEEADARLVAELRHRPATEARKVAAAGPTARRIRDADARTALMADQPGTHYRTLIRAGTLQDPVTLAWYRRMQEAGDTIRSTTDHLQPMFLLDRDRAFLPVVEDNADAGAVLVRHRGIVATLADLFDRMWRSAQDLDVFLSAEIDAVELRVLASLAENAKDEAAARSVNMSVRSFRRHVADLMQRVHADNRYQLAVIAKDRGWI